MGWGDVMEWTVGLWDGEMLCSGQWDYGMGRCYVVDSGIKGTGRGQVSGQWDYGKGQQDHGKRYL